eukprot:gene7844-16052_t
MSFLKAVYLWGIFRCGCSTIMQKTSSGTIFSPHLFPASIKGILFDMDGTLTDSDSLHYESFRQVLLELTPNFNAGQPISRDFYTKQMSGLNNPLIAPKIFPERSETFHKDFICAKEERFVKLSANLKRLDGLDRLLSWCDASGIKCIVVTNAPRVEAVHTLQILGLHRFIDEVIIAEECGSYKPLPGPYLAGLKHLGLPASACIAFEDSKAGCASAVAAGLCTVGISTSVPPEQLLQCGVSLVVENYTDKGMLQAIGLETINL